MKQRVMRKEGLVPTDASAEMPESYRLWRMCQRNNTLWWDGGMSNQPHILMLEFAVCETEYNSFQEYRNNMEHIVNAKG